jgi:hypothetical protein
LTNAQSTANNANATQSDVNTVLATLNSTHVGLTQNQPTNSEKLIHLWGKQTKYLSNFWNWIMVIFFFGWIWMAF